MTQPKQQLTLEELTILKADIIDFGSEPNYMAVLRVDNLSLVYRKNNTHYVLIDTKEVKKCRD